MKRRLRGVVVASVASVLCVLGSTATAWADGAELTATALFDEGRKLMAQNKYADACPKFAESQRLAPSGGTLINLAECYERAGQTASAWGAWKDVAARANAAGKLDVEQNAISRATALEPSLAKLTVGVTIESDVPGLTVKRDGLTVGHAEFGLAIPVDPGEHVVEATAPGKKPWSAQVQVAAKQTDARVTVLLVNDEHAAPPGTAPTTPTTPGAAPQQGAAPASPAPEAPSDGSTQRTIGWVTLGVGGAGVIVGSIFGASALGKSNQAKNEGCSGKTCPTSQGVSDTKSAIDAGNASTIAFVVGGVLAAAGVVVVLTAPSGSHVHVAPAVGQGYGGLSLGGSF
jgi:hypothetical protein